MAGVDGDECTRRASLHLRSLPNGVESFHAEGTSSSFTDREPSTFPFTRSLRREKFSRCQVKLTFFVSTIENFITRFLTVANAGPAALPLTRSPRRLHAFLRYYPVQPRVLEIVLSCRANGYSLSYQQVVTKDRGA